MMTATLLVLCYISLESLIMADVEFIRRPRCTGHIGIIFILIKMCRWQACGHARAMTNRGSSGLFFSHNPLAICKYILSGSSTWRYKIKHCSASCFSSATMESVSQIVFIDCSVTAFAI